VTTFKETMEHVVQGFEALGGIVLVVGSAVALASYLTSLAQGQPREAYERARQTVGRSILLGLEVLIIADIVQTITIDPTFENAGALGILVLVRTFLSVSIEVELDGSLPWRRPASAGTTGEDREGPDDQAS
jgi:uncharacterized membrane protein